jgi:two-component system chemotaxis response regulator CheY
MEQNSERVALDEMQRQSPDQSPGEIRRSLRVLLVDDNADHILLIRRILEQRGHVVSPGMSGKEAMALLAKGEYDVGVLDYQLPDATGLELLERIKQQAEGLPIVMVTASGNEQVAVAALKNGASDYVVKLPGYERELPRAIEQAAESARARAAETILRAELERRATTDPLTGLLNRGEMENRLKQEIERAIRYRLPLSFALMDIDGFKGINDTFGHPTGDAVLCHLAGVLQSTLRSSDIAARWGGDELSVLLPNTEFRGAKAFAVRLRSLARDFQEASGNKEMPPITLSVGFVLTRGSSLDLHLLLKWADRALYAAKAGGRDRANFFVLGEAEETSEEPEPCSSAVTCGERILDEGNS